MNKVRKEIECLARLQELTNSEDDLLGFLLSEILITKDQVAAIKRSPDRAKAIQGHLAGIQASGQTQLLEYHWDFLPVERIKILIVTDRNSKEFSYNF